MTRWRLVALWLCASGCTSSSASSGADATPDALADVATDAPADVATDAPADVATDAPADVATTTCDPGVIRMVPPGATFRVGSFCDELYLCAPDAAAAAEVARVTPAFVCAPESAVGALACGAGQWRCAWRSSTGGGVMVNADAYAAVCRALTLPTAPRAGMCLVFV